MAPPRGAKRKAEDKSKDAEADVDVQPARVSHPRKGLAPRKANIAATTTEEKTPPKKATRGAAKKKEKKEAEAPTSPMRKKRTMAAPVAAQPEPAKKQKEKEGRPAKKVRAKGPAKVPELNPTIPRSDTPANVYVFGKGEMAELGLGPAANARVVKRPRINHFLLPDKVGVVQMACGGMHSLALTKDGEVYSWGVNDQGALGRDTKWEAPIKDADASDSEDEDVDINPKESTPGLVEGFPEGINIVQVAAGDSISVAVTDEGFVYAWGTFRVSQILCQ